MSSIPMQQKHEPTPLWSLHSYRLLIALLLTFAFFCSISMRADLGIAIVCMVNSTAFLQNATVDLPKKTNGNDLPCRDVNMAELLIEEGYKGTILWTPEEQSMLFSANHYGGVLAVVPAGILADQFNPKLSLLAAIGDMAFFTLLTPFLSTWSFYATFVARIVMGLGEGFILPTMASISARWFPSTERSTAAALYTSGNQISSSVIYWIGASLCSTEFMGGWPLIFYLLGLIAISWMILWSAFASSSPGENRWISSAEQAYLNECLKNPQRKLSHGPIPWKSIARSMPVIANLIVMFGTNFNVTILQSFLPTYYRDVLLINLKKNGLYTTMPFCAQLVTKNVLGILSDQLTKRRLLKPTTACKIFQVAGNLTQVFSLLILAYFVDCSTPTLAVTLLILYGAAGASVTPGAITSCLSIAPSYSGTMISLAMLFGQLGSMVSPNVVALLRKHGTPQEWTWIFVLTALILTCSSIFFLIFASAEQQDWASGKTAARKQQIGDKQLASVMNDYQLSIFNRT